MDTTVLAGMIKWLFPATFGSCLALYYKAKEIGWENIQKEEKLKTFLLGSGAVVTGVFVAYVLGGVIVEAWDMDNSTKAYVAIYSLVGFSGVKLLDAFAKNTDKWVDKIIDTASSILDKVADKFKNW